MDEAAIRASIDRQLNRPMDKILAIVEERPTLAEQRERVQLAERALWGASVAMASVGMTDAGTRSSDPVEVTWWMLFDLIEATRSRWPRDERAEYDVGRHARRTVAWDQAIDKLPGVGLPVPNEPYARAVQCSTDEPPRQRFTFDVRYGAERGDLAVRDPFTGEWHEIASKDAPPSWRDIARTNWQREKASRA